MSAAFDLGPDVVELAPCAAPMPVGGGRLRELSFRADSWLPAEDARLRELFAADEAIDDIGTAIGRSFQAVRTRVWTLGLRRNSMRSWTDADDLELVDRYRAEPTSALALLLGRSVAAVYARAMILSLTQEHAPDYDEWEDAQIRAGYAAAVPVGQIATLIGRPLIGVRCRASLIGVRHPHQPPNWSDAEMTRALELAEAGGRYTAIVEQLAVDGFPRRTVRGFGLRVRKLGYGRGWGRRWIAEEDELLRRAYTTGASLTPIKIRLGRTTCSIQWRASELGLQGTHRNPDGFRTAPVWTPEQEEMLRDQYGKVPTPELARQLGRKTSAVMQRAALLGMRSGYIRPYSAEERRAIGIAWRRGLSMVDLAHALNRDPSVIGKTAQRLGLSFSDLARPMRGPRTNRSSREPLTLASILAIEPPSALDDAIEAKWIELTTLAARNRGAAASKRKGHVMNASEHA